jgi:hypothetical protein
VRLARRHILVYFVFRLSTYRDSSSVISTVYSQLITLTTPSLHSQLDKLSLTLDFLRVSSGHLLIAQVEDAIACAIRFPAHLGICSTHRLTRHGHGTTLRVPTSCYMK